MTVITAQSKKAQAVGSYEHIADPYVFLKSNGIEYEERIVDLKEVAERTEHQVRFDLLKTDHAEMLRSVFNGGTSFPPIILNQTSPGRLSIIDGVHRIWVYRQEGIHMVKALVVKVDDLEFGRLCAEVNRGHGLPLSRAESVALAIFNYDRGAYATLNDAAAAAGVSNSSLRSELNARDATIKAERLGCHLGEDVGTTAREKLFQIKNDDIFKHVANIVVDHRMPIDHFKKLVQSVKANEESVASATEAADKYLAEFQKERGIVKKRAYTPSPLLANIGSILKMGEGDALQQLRLLSDDKRQEKIRDMRAAGIRYQAWADAAER